MTNQMAELESADQEVHTTAPAAANVKSVEEEVGAVHVQENSELDSIDETNLTPHQKESLKIARKIIYVLTTYPCISPTMLQMGIGPSTKPTVWKPVLEQLIKEDFVVREIKAMKTLTGGLRQAVIIRLSNTKYTSPYEYRSTEAGFESGGGDEDADLE